METTFFEHIRENLLEQRRNLMTWLNTTPAQKKQIRLGPADEQAVQSHLQVLDTALAKAEDKTLGVCEVCHDYVEPSRLEMDYTACVCVDHLSTAEKRMLEDELEFSQKVQQSLLPQQIPDIPGLELAAFSQPARIVGGDYFDFFEYPDGSHGLAIADVVDKGVPASLLMPSLQASLRILVPESDSPASVAERLNRLLSHNVQLTQFVTLFLARFDPQTRRLQYCNAGQNPPLLFHTDENGECSLTWLQPTGAAIGLIEQAQFQTETITLSLGDILVLYTDGVTDTRSPDGEEFRSPRLAEFVRQNSQRSATDLMQGLRRSLQAFSNGRPPEDDTTIVTCRIVG